MISPVASDRSRIASEQREVQTSASAKTTDQSAPRRPPNTLIVAFLSSVGPGKGPASPDAFSNITLTKEQKEMLEKQRVVADDLKRMTDQMRSDRKASASERIIRIKAELEMLRKFAAADPQGAGKRAAQLARELASAARDYADSGSSGGGGVSAVAPVSGATAPTATTAESAAPLQAVDIAKGEVPPSTVPSPDAASPQTGRDEKTSGPSDDGDDKNKRDLSTFGLSPERLAALAQARADSELVALIRQLAAEIKAILKQAQKAAKEENKDQQDEATGVSDSFAAIEKAASDISASASASLMASYAPPVAVAATVSVSA